MLDNAEHFTNCVVKIDSVSNQIKNERTNDRKRWAAEKAQIICSCATQSHSPSEYAISQAHHKKWLCSRKKCFFAQTHKKWPMVGLVLRLFLESTTAHFSTKYQFVWETNAQFFFFAFYSPAVTLVPSPQGLVSGIWVTCCGDVMTVTCFCRCSLLASLAYVSLCLNDHVMALNFSKRLLDQPRLSGAHK